MNSGKAGKTKRASGTHSIRQKQNHIFLQKVAETGSAFSAMLSLIKLLTYFLLVWCYGPLTSILPNKASHLWIRLLNTNFMCLVKKQHAPATPTSTVNERLSCFK